jgi:hypothetical protein
MAAIPSTCINSRTTASHFLAVSAGVSGGIVTLAGDLHDNLAAAD